MVTWFTDTLCIEWDACIDICPVQCLMITPNGEEAQLRLRTPAPALNLTQPFFASGELPQTKRIMVKDEDVCIHCGLCAERCPTAAWDMRKFDLLLPYAGRPAGAAEELAPA
jgi:formate dehydrogenase (NADP+) beta subunit